jgi:hypothetical protein|tara:strand:- start:390 stop:713 length:324 start_codon:yes stop_codon:yes gene_type:complete
MKKIINGEVFEMTAEEISQRETEVQEWNSKSAERKLAQIKNIRLDKLKETDYMANSDYTMPDNIKTWRQSLRDIPQDYTTESQYDTLLEMEGDIPNRKLKHAIWSKP